jgi:hydroxymethylpyrimidine pyrophosphatase-like HAD family hydrolase
LGLAELRLKPAPASGPASVAPLLERNLLLSFEELAERFLERITVCFASNSLSGGEQPGGWREDDDLLDCFLLAAGLSQVLDDHLHRHPLSLGKAPKHLAALSPVIGPLAANAAKVANRAGFGLRAWLPREKRLVRRQGELAMLVADLANQVVSRAQRVPRDRADGPFPLPRGLREAAERLLLPFEQFPLELRRTIARLPNCFRSFDQRPEDFARLVERFSARWPDRAQPLLVLGLRTSGSYLAPLVASYLAAEGYADVNAATIRPGFLLSGEEALTLTTIAQAGGLALVVDDPPRTGVQLADAISELCERGFARDSILPMLQLFGPSDSLPEIVRSHAGVYLPWDEWTVHELFGTDALERTLGELLLGRTISLTSGMELCVGEVRVEDTAVSAPRRGHGRVVFTARFVDHASGREAVESICAEGVGLGYFGRHALVIAEALRGSVPAVLGLRNGLLFRTWLPAETRVSGTRLSQNLDAVAGEIAQYVERRSRTLQIGEDVSLRIIGREPAWELVADMLGRAFGRAKPFVRPLTRRVAQRLVRVEHASVTDGDTAPWNWFGEPGDTYRGLRKVNFDTRAFSNVGIASCDPILDLAGAAAGGEAVGVGELEKTLRHRYESLTGEMIGDERWLIYRLLHHLTDYRALLQQVAADPDAGHDLFARLLAREQTMADIHQRYIAAHYFADLASPESGPLCAIDIDGVLETRWLAFPALAPAGALALRALNRHGYRVLLASGRSLSEVRSRCRAYRLAGGVAEYGSAIYDSQTEAARSLLTDDDQAGLGALRTALAELPTAYLDPAYRHSVRVHTLNAAGERASLPPKVVAAALAGSGVGARVRVINGDLQTDFVGVRADKVRGVRALAAELGDTVEAGGCPLAFAVGDTVSDLPLLELARFAFAPANAEKQLHGRVPLMRRPYQSGLLQAVSRFLGHRPGHCRICAPSRPASLDSRLLSVSLAALNGGDSGKVAQALALAALLATSE